jgi:hypothetical protein
MAKDPREQVVQSAARLRTMLEDLERLARDPAARADQLNRLQQRIHGAGSAADQPGGPDPDRTCAYAGLAARGLPEGRPRPHTR